MFPVLPFWLTTAPFIFTKLLRPIVKHWCSQETQEISTVVYLDDGFDIERYIQTCTSNSGLIRSDLSSAWLLVNDEKRVWRPTQSLTWFGLNWNGQTGTISIISERIDKFGKVLHSWFRLFEGRFGPHTVDCFADCYNCRVQKFYSRFWIPGSVGIVGIDAFFHPWEVGNALIVLPRAYRVLAFLQSQSHFFLSLLTFWLFWLFLISRVSVYMKDYIVLVGN